MKRKREILRIILIVLIAIFLMVGIAALLLAGHRRSERQEQQKQAALESLKSVPTVAPTVAVTITPTPTPIPTATPTPTPVPTLKPAFNPDDYWDDWYSTDGLAAVTIYNISQKAVSFYFTQASDAAGTQICEADITAEVAGNAAQFSFTDSWGNRAAGNMIFDNGELYVRINTNERVEGLSVCPSVNCIMSRTRPEIRQEQPAEPTPTPAETQTGVQTGEYYFPESNSRYLTDEELASYSSADLELAKNEIYARHGRQFVTERIAAYFNSKSWYQGTIDPETFDAQQDSIFNEYETANISKILEWEEKKRSEGN